MSDLQLLTFGASVSFIVVAGAYVFLRERWLASHRVARERARRARRSDRRVRTTS